MTYLKPAHQDVIRMARSLIRDAAMNWARDELAADPEAVCEQLSGMLGEEYNFEKGTVVKPPDKKTNLFQDTVIRKDDASGELFLVNHPEKGWSSYMVGVPNIEYVLEHYNVTVGDWDKDDVSSFCPVRIVKPST
jgi:hypothetical protein